MFPFRMAEQQQAHLPGGATMGRSSEQLRYHYEVEREFAQRLPALAPAGRPAEN